MSIHKKDDFKHIKRTPCTHSRMFGNGVRVDNSGHPILETEFCCLMLSDVCCCVFVCVCVRACVRACVYVCVRACAHPAWSVCVLGCVCFSIFMW